MKKVTLTDRILALLSGGDKAKLVRFESKLEKYFIKQVAMRKEKIENLKEKIVDANEELNEAVLQVNVDVLNSTDSAESYVSTYVNQVQRKFDAKENLEEQISILELEVEKLDKLQASIYSEETV